MTGFFDTVGRTIFRLGYEISPIVLSGGLANNVPGGYLPIVALTEAANFVIGLLSGGTDFELDKFFAHFRPMPGSTLIENQIGRYPFANQTVAANAIITQPLRVSMLMNCPVRDSGGYTTKLLTLTALQMALSQHNSAGGTYIIATPSFLYQDCIMTGLRDVSSGESKQTQTSWQFDFEQPLITTAEAQAAQNNLMDKLTNGLQTDGSLSGPGATVGNSLTGASAMTAPVSANLTGTSVIPVTSSPLMPL